MEITNREIIVSVAIVSIMLIIGTMLSGIISDNIADNNAIYNKAIHVEDKDIFEYGMKTNVGNAFVYGDLIAIDTVGYPDIEGEYLYVEKVKERYTMHTRTVSYKCGKNTCFRTENYWTWDVVNRESKSSEKVTFLGVEFNFNQFKRPSDKYIETVKESSKVRYKYYGVPSKLKGTIFANLKDNNIGKDVKLYQDMTTQVAHERLVSNNLPLWGFWVLWIALIGGAVYGFYYLENNWLY